MSGKRFIRVWAMRQQSWDFLTETHDTVVGDENVLQILGFAESDETGDLVAEFTPPWAWEIVELGGSSE